MPASLLIAIVLLLSALVLGGYFLRRRRRFKHLQAQEAVRLAEKKERQALRRAKRQAERAKEIQVASAARHAGDRRPIILVVDDSSTVLQSTKKMLEDHRYRVITASHGKEAWHALQDTTLKPDLILTDIEMPHLDGYGLLRLIRADFSIADVPVILMTANPSGHLHAGQEEGVNGFLPKPFEAKDLVGQIRYLLQQN